MKVLPVNKFRCFLQKAALARRDVAEISTTIIKLTASGLRTVNRGTIKRGQLIAGQLIAWTHNRSDN